MKKALFFIVLFFGISLASLNAQVYSYYTTDVCYASADSTGTWGAWGEWIEDDTDITIDIENSEITFYDYWLDLEYVYYIDSHTEEKTDEDGDLVTEYSCTDENFDSFTIKLMKRLSSEDKRTEIYVYGDTNAEAYIVEENEY